MSDPIITAENQPQIAKIKCHDPRFDLYTNNQMFIVTSDNADFDTEHTVKFLSNDNDYIDIAPGDKFTRLGTNKRPRPDRTTIEAQDRWHFRVEGFIHDFHITTDDHVSLMLFKAINTYEEEALNEFAKEADKTQAYYAVTVTPAPEGESVDRVIFGVVDTKKQNSYILKGFEFNVKQTIAEVIIDNSDEINEFNERETFE
jgi:hypothetical protein